MIVQFIEFEGILFPVAEVEESRKEMASRFIAVEKENWEE